MYLVVLHWKAYRHSMMAGVNTDLGGVVYCVYKCISSKSFLFLFSLKTVLMGNNTF